jgi:antitoxin YefM
MSLRIVVSTEDWEREQETLYILQNKSLMEQLERSLKTHRAGKGHRLSPKDLDVLDRI